MQHTKYNTHVQREVELSPPELSMTEKGTKQQFVEIRHTPFNIIGQYRLWRLQTSENSKKSSRKSNLLTLR